MNTTNVFVELLVIGLGPVTAIVLLTVVMLAPDTVMIAAGFAAQSPLLVLAPLLAATYVFGIITDRIADRLFAVLGQAKIRRRFFETDAGYHDARRTIVVHAESLNNIRQYGRSRMRICRGWSLNALLLLVPLNLYAAWVLPPEGAGVFLLINGVLGATFIGSVYSWYVLSKSEYEKIKGGADFVRRQLLRHPGTPAVGSAAALDARVRETAPGRSPRSSPGS